MSKELGALRGVYTNYGARPLGGSAGVQKTEGGSNEITFELMAGDLLNAGYAVPVPANYLVVVDSILLEVETVFAASSTADLSIGGGAGLTTKLPLTVAGLSSKVTTGLANLSGTTASSVTITANANAIASAAGKAKVVLSYKAI
jgi:hypothetical protein